METPNSADVVPRDLRVAWRGLRREPLWATFIILTLGLGIGANAALFRVVDRLLLTGPTAIAESDRVVRLYHTSVESDGGRATASPFDFPALPALEGVRAFDMASGYALIGATLGRGREARHISAGYVTDNFFQLLGARATVGNTSPLSATDASLDGAVISYAHWQAAFAGSDSAIGATGIVNDVAYVIRGVAPRGFTGAELGRVDLWLPARALGARLGPEWQSAWDAPWMTIIARLAPGVERGQAQTEATAAFRRVYAGADRGTASAVVSLGALTRNANGDLSSQASLSAWLAFFALAVLAIACVNVASLLIARTTRRQHEHGIRLALGASRGDLVRLSVAEACLLTVGGGVAAVGASVAADMLIRTRLLPEIDWTSAVIDVRGMLVIVFAVIVIGIGIGLIPARRALGLNVLAALRSAAGRGGGSGRSLRALTVVQAALSTVLLITAGLFIRSLFTARSLDYGIEPRRVVVANVEWSRLAVPTPADRRTESARRLGILSDAAERVRAVPGVTAVTVAMGSPYRNSARAQLRAAADSAATGWLEPSPRLYAVAPEYFHTVGTTIRAGRTFESSDGPAGERVAIVSEGLATRLWPRQSPLGQCLTIRRVDAACARVVGVAAETRGIRTTAASQVYVPLAQAPVQESAALLIRASTSIERTGPAIRDAVSGVSPTVRYVDVRALQSFLEPELRPWELGALMFTVMGGLALATAMCGLFGITSYTTARREHEFGIRRALGASSVSIMMLIARGSVVMAAVGTVMGIGASLMTARYLRSLLYAKTVIDPIVFGLVIGAMVLAAIGAAAIPARQMLRKSPADTLRSG